MAATLCTAVYRAHINRALMSPKAPSSIRGKEGEPNSISITFWNYIAFLLVILIGILRKTFRKAMKRGAVLDVNEDSLRRIGRGGEKKQESYRRMKSGRIHH
jgi:hypothetical protein